MEDTGSPSASLYAELSGNHYGDFYGNAAEIRNRRKSGEKTGTLDIYQKCGYSAVS